MLLTKTLADERGIVLVVCLLTIALLIGAGAAAILSTQTDLRTSGNLSSGNRAFYIAQAGVNHARSELQSRNGNMSFNQAMQASTGAIIASNPSFSGGTYRVTTLESATNPDRIRAVSRGTASNNSVSEVEAWFRKDPGRPPKAIITGADLTVSGSPKLIGACGGAHSNDDMQVSGNPAVQMADGLTAANMNVAGGAIPEGMNIPGSPCIGNAACATSSQGLSANNLDSLQKRAAYESSHNSAVPYDIPRINPADYAPHVASLGINGNGYILHDDGTVTAGPGISCDPSGFCAGGAFVPVPAGWSFSQGTWSVGSVTAADGVFYSETKIDISGNIGTASLPWQATIIARDSIRATSDLYWRPYPTPSLPLKDHLLVTGNDLDISGNMTATYAPGAILVHQQLRITKNPQITGFIIAGDGQSTWAGDPFTNSSLGVALNDISGNPTIDYACQFGCLGPGCPWPAVAVTGWKQKF
jgi:Tfp pilus assembly protein PilX